MPINEIIREKRKTLGLTQEQVAERLGVSAPAVNKWEKGASYPDVTLLPPLARLLGTDLNTLLCFRDGLSQQEIEELFKQATAAIDQEGFARGSAFLLQKVQEYPTCFSLVYPAAMLLDGALILSGLSAEEKRPFEQQVTALYERTVDGGEEPFASRAAFLLASRYLNQRRFEKAQELLDKLPASSGLDKRTLQAALFLQQDQPEQAAPLLERKVLTEAQGLVNLLLQLSALALQEERPDEAGQITTLACRLTGLLGLGDYYAALPLWELAVTKKDVPGSISAIKTMLDAAAASQWYPTGPLYRHIYEKPPVAPPALDDKLLPSLLVTLEQDEKYDFLRKEPEFEQLLRQYRTKYPKK